MAIATAKTADDVNVVFFFYVDTTSITIYIGIVTNDDLT